MLYVLESMIVKYAIYDCTKDMQFKCPFRKFDIRIERGNAGDTE
jgi:hypothetical protein